MTIYSQIGGGGGGGGGGDVTGPGSSTDNALARFDGTTGKIIQNSNATLSDAGDLSLASPLEETSGGTGQSTYTTGDILYASAANTLAKLAIPQAGSILMSDGTNVYWANASNTYIMYEDFYNEFSPGTLGFRGTASGAGSAVNNFDDGTQNNSGIVSLETGTDTNGRASLYSSDRTVILGGGIQVIEWLLTVDALSNPTNRYIIRAGIGNTETQDVTRANDCVYFEYAEDGTAAFDNWRLVTSSGGTATSTDSTVAAVADWIKLRIEINADASSVEFFINGVSVGTNTTNINTTSTMGVNCGIVKTAGTTEREMFTDYAYHFIKFTTPR